MNADATQMNAIGRRDRLNQLSATVIGAAQRVSSALGFGFLEKVYENSLMLELQKERVDVAQQPLIEVRYQGVIVGNYVPDLLIDGSLVVEIKAVPGIELAHRMQCLNYLRATNLNLAVLLNFGRPHLQVARIVWHF
jgi:GxxExxY protein